MIDRFRIGGTLGGLLAGFLPIGDGLLHEAGLCVVMSKKFGLRLADFRKLLF